MTRLAIYLQDAHPIGEAIEFTRYAEQRGFEAVWQADSRRLRRLHRHHQDRIGGRRLLDP